MLQTLSCHPDFSTDAISAIDVHVEYLPSGNIAFHYNVFGAVDQLKLPEPIMPERTDHLWQKTCFEAFVGVPDDPGYLELNFSSSTEWAVYAFESYREGMGNPGLVNAPRIQTSTTANNFELVATFDLSGLPISAADNLEMALAAVIEEKHGRKSLWALKHPLGNPDFHNRGCFIHKLKVAESR